MNPIYLDWAPNTRFFINVHLLLYDGIDVNYSLP